MRGPDRLDISRADTVLHDAATIWIVDNLELYEGDTPLGAPRLVAVRASLPADKSFASYDEALAHVTGARLPGDAELFWSQGLIDVLVEYPIQSDTSDFSIDPKFARLGQRTVTVLRFCRRAAPCAPSSTSATSAWSASIPAGIRPRSGLSSWASSIFSTAPTTCCFSCAW